MLLYLNAELAFDDEINLIPEVMSKVDHIHSFVEIKSLETIVSVISKPFGNPNVKKRKRK